MYDTIFAKSFSRREQKRLRCGAFLFCLLLVLSLCTVFKPYLGPIHVLSLKLSLVVDTKMFMVNDTSSSPHTAKVENVVAKIVDDTKSSPQMNDAESVLQEILFNDTRSSQQIAKDEENVTKNILTNGTRSSPQKAEVEEIETKKLESLCTSEERTDFCQSQGDIRIHGKSSSVYIVSPETTLSAENISWRIRPYARKDDAYAMVQVREWSVKPVKVSQKVPQCTKNHSIPTVLFSTGGYIGNHFHEFTDVLIPLFLTCRHFNGEVQFIITDKRPWWILKYQPVLNKLSNYDIIDIDSDDEVHCFLSVSVGLKRYRKELSIDPQKYSYSMKDFRDFLRSSYSLKRVQAIKIRDDQPKKPRLLIISRQRSRSFTNIAQIAKMAKRLGFIVIIKEGGGSMSSFANAVNSCDVLMGVHGAGLTNILFLPENAVFVQVLPHGSVEWLAKNDFAEPSKDMNLKYLEYKIRLEESTLIQQYPLDHIILKDPPPIGKISWETFKTVYFDKQNVRLDVKRFKPTLLKALELLHQ
ncbi:hypothetical protein TanjilG_21946 [Lupinus angustifolius]|uniref:Glycosyltransferase 61 catalytic domain-containing protein n=1 Tax=Lupinus angustifolius TaxID=3871 RepID=A0A1J7I7M2_LUPAN|nr:PREDICTED: uncharacterized protein LOC109349709 [Lupinus angustifolius]OIW10109.1 hypothetical protein TanjilG_21946 [Lupinus angustifolius]